MMMMMMIKHILKTEQIFFNFVDKNYFSEDVFLTIEQIKK